MKGYLAALSAYIFWGLSPLFWKLLTEVPATEILIHRIIWSLPLLLALIFIRGQGASFFARIKSAKTLKVYIISAFLLAGNWLTYIWAVNNNFIVEASLGYFINPLVNVLLGVIFLKERMRPLQWLSVLLATAGVLYLTFHYGQFPWIALTLAFSFGIYGFIRKTGTMEALEGLSYEMMVLFIPGLLFMFYLARNGGLYISTAPAGMNTLLILTGMITILPLIWFAYGARRIPLGTLGFLQYIGPTLQFLLGVFLYHEPFDSARLTGFGLIWLALLIYSLELTYRLRRGHAGAGG